MKCSFQACKLPSYLLTSNESKVLKKAAYFDGVLQCYSYKRAHCYVFTNILSIILTNLNTDKASCSYLEKVASLGINMVGRERFAMVEHNQSPFTRPGFGFHCIAQIWFLGTANTKTY